MIIGLTGNIATGKSTISKMFQQTYNIPVIDADMVAREVVEPGEQTLDEIVKTFGNVVLLESGSLNRQKLGEIIFENSKKREKLNKIIHPAIRLRMEEKKQMLLNENNNEVVLDIPLLYENKLTYLVDKTIVVFTDKKTQLQRLMKRNQLTKKEAIERMNAQMDIEIKKKRADALIENSGAIEASNRQLEAILIKWGIYSNRF